MLAIASRDSAMFFWRLIDTKKEGSCRDSDCELLMDQPSQFTLYMHSQIEKIQAGDVEARNALLRSVAARMERLARRMLRKNPRVRRWAETDDVLQNSLIRLLRALETVKPANTREFFSLAATQIRRELTDLARRYYGACGPGHTQDQAVDLDELPAEAHELEAWANFHEAVESLSQNQREVVSLVFYHGWTQQQVADSFGVNARTIRRWWLDALVCLRARCKELPLS